MDANISTMTMPKTMAVQNFLRYISFKATSVGGVTLSAEYLGFFLNVAELACMAKFKTEPKWAAV